MKLDGQATIRVYDVVSRAVEEGARYGWARAHKHCDKPDRELILDAIVSAVMSSLDEVIVWGVEE